MGVFNFQPVDLSASPASALVHIGFCKVNAFYVFNHTAAIIYLQIFDLGRAPVLGVDKPTWQFGVSAGTSANVGAPPASFTGLAGFKCVNGLAYALTNTFGPSNSLVNNTNPASPQADGSIDWEVRP
jgi:hypothetical protein